MSQLGVTVKAKRKPPPLQLDQTPRPSRAGPAPSIVRKGRPTDEEPTRSGFVAAHQALLALLPPGVHAKLPAVPPTTPARPSRCDYSDIIDWLKLPRFKRQNTTPNWVDHFAPSCKKNKRLIVHRLAEVVELGAEPQLRQEDLFFAWWELTFMEAELHQSMPKLSPAPDDPQRVMPESESTRIASGSRVASAIQRLRTGRTALDATGWRQRSVLGLLGYHVGCSGAMKNERHTALEACLVFDGALLPTVQRSFWGNAATRRRLRAIQRMIALFRSLASARHHGEWRKACADWSADLEWLENVYPIRHPPHSSGNDPGPKTAAGPVRPGPGRPLARLEKLRGTVKGIERRSESTRGRFP